MKYRHKPEVVEAVEVPKPALGQTLWWTTFPDGRQQYLTDAEFRRDYEPDISDVRIFGIDDDQRGYRIDTEGGRDVSGVCSLVDFTANVKLLLGLLAKEGKWTRDTSDAVRAVDNGLQAGVYLGEPVTDG